MGDRAENETRGTAHVISVDSSFLDPGYWAACSCGWRSIVRAPSQQVALEQGEQHRYEAGRGGGGADE